MNEGTIIKGVGGFYYVRMDKGELLELRARGRFRNDDIKPLPGDRVYVDGGMICEILPRRNQLVRPAVANIDQLCIVLSAGKPAPDLLLADKLMLHAYKSGIDVMICINKTDSPKGTIDIASQYERSGAKIIYASAKTGENLDAVKEQLKGKNTCLAGQSAVGKSSLINALCPQLYLETGGLAKKTDRGRHTTRHSELIEIREIDATVVDTPGFSILSATNIEPEELARWYPDFQDVGKCRFDSCAHDKEPECAVKAAVLNGEISKERYERYLTIFSELKIRRDKQYD